MKQYHRYLIGAVVLTLGCLLNHFGDKLLGVHIELYYGLTDFSVFWIADMFILPLVVGFIIAVIYGYGGKWWAMFPPLIVHTISYIQFGHMADIGQLPQGAVIQPAGWWGFFVIVQMEVAMVGGVLGEAIVKRTYGRRPKHLVFKQRDSVSK